MICLSDHEPRHKVRVLSNVEQVGGRLYFKNMPTVAQEIIDATGCRRIPQPGRKPAVLVVRDDFSGRWREVTGLRRLLSVAGPYFWTRRQNLPDHYGSLFSAPTMGETLAHLRMFAPELELEAEVETRGGRLVTA